MEVCETYRLARLAILIRGATSNRFAAFRSVDFVTGNARFIVRKDMLVDQLPDLGKYVNVCIRRRSMVVNKLYASSPTRVAQGSKTTSWKRLLEVTICPAQPWSKGSGNIMAPGSMPARRFAGLTLMISWLGHQPMVRIKNARCMFGHMGTGRAGHSVENMNLVNLPEYDPAHQGK